MDFGDVEYWERFYRRYLPPAKPPGEGEAALSTGADRGSGGAEQQLLEQDEWYLEASALVPRLLPCLPSLAEEGQLPAVLMLGCGSSRLSELLYEAGYHHITNVDFSPLVIASMQENTRSACPTLQWLVADVTHMPAIASSSFDVAIDKGTLDAIMSATEWQTSAPAMGAEVHRVLKPGGLWLLCSFGDDRAECVDEQLSELGADADPALNRCEGRSERWHAVRERIALPAHSPEKEAGGGGALEEEEAGAWYLYAFTKLPAGE